APPETRIVRTLLLWARALEAGWKTLVSRLTPDIAPDEADPLRNKALQLAELFRLSYELTVAAGSQDPVAADGMFRANVPEWLARGDLRSVLPGPNGGLLTSEECAAWMSEAFCSMEPRAALQDIFKDAAMDAPAEHAAAPTLFSERQRLKASLDAGHDARLMSAQNRATQVEEALKEARANPRATDMAADIEYLAALHSLSSGKFDEARRVLDRGRELCTKGSFGPVRLHLARVSLALSVSGEAFNQNRCEADFRVLFRSISPEEVERWKIGSAPREYSMRRSAVDISNWFWEGEFMNPYPGVSIERPLEERAPIFEEFVRLILSDADEREIRTFLARHKTVLKRKLRDVRGDTFFTMITKMVPDLLSVFVAMSPLDKMRGSPSSPTASQLSERIRATYLRFVNLLPTDLLEARDYLGQTALMRKRRLNGTGISA
ncbi:hypothetical protein AB9K41_13165, partial [Cribrihabitans sp. XS_ASV171]